MRDVVVVGAGMTRFGKHLDRSLKVLGQSAVESAVDDAGIRLGDIEVAFVGNAMAGIVQGQESVRGQVILHAFGLRQIPVFNVDNACASGSSAFHLAWLSVASGAQEVALVLGVEKLYHPDKAVSYRALASATDVEATPAQAPDARIFMDLYAAWARSYIERSGATVDDFAQVAVKNRRHASLNPDAQFRELIDAADVLGSPLVSAPLTRLMCSPIADGAAAVIICSAERARRVGSRPVTVAASVVVSGADPAQNGASSVARAAGRAYAMAGVGPEDVDVAEVHDATTPAELVALEELSLCGPGQSVELLRTGALELGGRLPVNTSGGLVSRGHPVGATGIGQICEIVRQLRGEAAGRQVDGARVGLTENGGGWVAGDTAATTVHLFTT